MALGFANLPNMVISSGQTNSNTIILFEDAWGMSIQAPVVDSTTINVLGVNTTSTTQSFAVLQSGGQDIVFFSGKLLTLTPCPWRQLQLQCSQAESAQRTFTVAKVFPV